MRPNKLIGACSLCLVLLVGQIDRNAIVLAQVPASLHDIPAPGASGANAREGYLARTLEQSGRTGQSNQQLGSHSSNNSNGQVRIPDQIWTGNSSLPNSSFASGNMSQATTLPTQGQVGVGIGAVQQELRPSGSSVIPASFESPVGSKSRTPLQPKSKSDSSLKNSSGGSKLQMLVSVGTSLAIVIGLFFGVAMLYRKSLAATIGKSLPKNVVQVLGRTAVAHRQQLVLLRFGSKLVLVSMIQGEARTISEITDPLEVDQLAGLCESVQPTSSSSSFRELLFQGVKA